MNSKNPPLRKTMRSNRHQLDTQGKAKPVVSAADAAHLLVDTVWLVVLLASLLLAVALFSFSMTDPSWSRGIGDVGQSRNLLGVLGAYVADVAYYVLGYSAWWLLPIALMGLYRNFRPLQGQSRRPYRVGLGLAGLVLLLFGSPMLEAALWENRLDAQLPVGAGGIIGGGIGAWLHGWLGFSGSLLVFMVLILTGWYAMLQLSWLDVSEKIGAKLEGFWRRLLRQPPDVIKEIPKEKFARRMVRQAQNITAQQVENVTGIVSNRQHGRIQIRTEPPEPIELQTDLFDVKNNVAILGFRLPDLTLLTAPPPVHTHAGKPDDLKYVAEQIEHVFAQHGFEVVVVGAVVGPVLTLFEAETAANLDVLRNSGVPHNLAEMLSVSAVRLTEAAPAGGRIGIEVPNRHRQTVYLSEILAAPVVSQAVSPLTVAVGKDIAGFPVAADLAKMPHLLMGGMRGSGKADGLHTVLLSLLYRNTPEQLRLLLLAPASSVLSVYRDVPHLLQPLLSDAAPVRHVLDWCAAENERRVQLLAHVGVDDWAAFNQAVQTAQDNGHPLLDPFSPNPDEPEALSILPYCVVVVDELDVLLSAQEIHDTIVPLVKNSGATGIHFVLACTQPDVDVLTGYLKTHIPARMAFTVEDRVASRALLDQAGAEHLLLQGDMLFLQPNQVEPVRIQSPFVANHEVAAVVGHCVRQAGAEYWDGLVDGRAAIRIRNVITPNAASDELYEAAVAYVLQSRKASVSALQRQFRIGYNRADRILQALENSGVISSVQVGRGRQVLLSSVNEPHSVSNRTQAT